MPDPDEMTREQLAEVDQLLANNPTGARWNLLRQLASEHPEHIKLDVSLNPDPDARDPDRAPMKVTVKWRIAARATKEFQRWDAYVRYELKKRLGLDEPTSLTDEQGAALQIRDRQP